MARHLARALFVIALTAAAPLRFFVTAFDKVECDRWASKAEYLDAENAALARGQLHGAIDELDGRLVVLNAEVRSLRHRGPEAYDAMGRTAAEVWTVRAYRALAFSTLDGVLADQELSGRENRAQFVLRKSRYCRRVQALSEQIKAQEASR